jgi:ankyrin repeat protein
VRWLIDHGATVEPKNSVGETVLVYAAMNERAGIYQYLMSLPRQQPIDFYFDDFSADRIFRNDDLVMRSHLIGLGLSRRFECE